MSDALRSRTTSIRVVCFGLAAVVALLLTGPGASFAQSSTAALITAPQPGTTLIGVVNIIGSASDPDFQRYRLEFSLQDSGIEQWLLITEVTQQVTNGVLAQWDTTQVPDGIYQIRLRVILRNGTVVQLVVRDLNIANLQPTSLPTLPASPTAAPATPTATAGPTPTSIIDQPATQPPRPATAEPPIIVAAPPPVEPGGDETPGGFVFALNALQNAFCAGFYLAVVAFGLLFVYRVVYSRLRPRLRKMWAESQADEV